MTEQIQSANIIADELEKITDLRWYASELLRKDAITMLRHQAQEIADLKITNQDLKYQLIQKAGEQVLTDFKELIDEDNDIFRKEQVEKFYAEARPLSEKYKLSELTDEEIWKVISHFSFKDLSSDLIKFARAIIKASRGEK